MALIQNYAFDNMSRIGNDNCGLTERNILNSDHANWMLTNYFQNDCGMKKGLDFALSAPNINYTGSHQVGLGGCNIDQNSSLLIDPISRPACRISLFQRPFATVPFLGRGKVDAGMESELQQGDQISNRKTNTNIPEKTYLKHRYVPMIPSVADTISNPANLVEGVASHGWIRGGLPSRELVRDENK